MNYIVYSLEKCTINLRSLKLKIKTRDRYLWTLNLKIRTGNDFLPNLQLIYLNSL